jgi:fructokinase
MGHMQVPAPSTPGVANPRCECPFHDSCLEGFVSGPAIAARWGMKAEALPAGHPAIDEVALTLARGLISIILTLAPRRVILGGGVMKLPGVITAVRSNVVRMLNGYMQVPAIITDIDRYIVAPGLGDRAGVLGAIALGLRRLQ